jgi:hypothetical protein
LVPVTENGDVALDDSVSIVETWKGQLKISADLFSGVC